MTREVTDQGAQLVISVGPHSGCFRKSEDQTSRWPLTDKILPAMGLTSFLTSFVLFSVIELSYIVVCGKLQIVVIHDNFHQCNFSHKVVNKS